MNKAARKEHNQRIAAQLKKDGIERTTGRCPICGRIYHANMLREGYLAHRCEGRREKD